MKVKMSINNLKKCPFCGGEAVFRVNNNSSSHHGVGFSFKIECEKCKIESPKSYDVKFILNGVGEINPIHDERNQAVEDWNKRIQK